MQKTNSRESLMGRQLFVGNIPFHVGWQDIKDLMREAGNVVRVNIMQNPNGQSKGHAIVLFSTSADAHKAIGIFNNYKWHGRTLEVREDKSLNNIVRPPGENRSLEDLPSSQAGAVVKSTQLDPGPQRQVFVSNLPFIVGWQDLKDLFREAGLVIRADIKIDNKTGKSKGHGIVLFSSAREAALAVEMFHDFEWFGRKIDVREDRSQAKEATSEEIGAASSESLVSNAASAKSQSAAGKQKDQKKSQQFIKEVELPKVNQPDKPVESNLDTVEPAISPQQSSWADRVRKVSVGSLSTTSSAPPLKSPTSQPENAQQQRSVAGISAYQCGYKANSGYNSPDSDNWKLDLERRGDAILSDLSETAFSEVYQTPERDDCGEYNAGSGGIAVSVTPRNRRPSRSGDLTKISPESDNLFPLPGSSGSSMAMPTRYFGGGNNSIFGSADLAISGSHHTANGRDIFGISLPTAAFSALSTSEPGLSYGQHMRSFYQQQSSVMNGSAPIISVGNTPIGPITRPGRSNSLLQQQQQPSKQQQQLSAQPDSASYAQLSIHQQQQQRQFSSSASSTATAASASAPRNNSSSSSSIPAAANHHHHHSKFAPLPSAANTTSRIPPKSILSSKLGRMSYVTTVAAPSSPIIASSTSSLREPVAGIWHQQKQQQQHQQSHSHNHLNNNIININQQKNTSLQMVAKGPAFIPPPADLSSVRRH